MSNATAPYVNTSGGNLTFNADEDGNYRGGAPTEQFVVVRREDGPLFTGVTRGEYLQQFRGELEAYKSGETEANRANAGPPAVFPKSVRCDGPLPSHEPHLD